MKNRWKTGLTIGIIGGRGEMGSFFGRLFKNLGYTVLISDIGTKYSNRQLIDESDIVIFSVPLHKSVEIIEENVPYTREDQLIMDVSSIKGPQVKAMLKGPASVVGLHPMFGGKIQNTKGQTIVACPARILDNLWETVKSQFKKEGFRIVECSPEKHDEMMAIIQVLFHFSSMLKGKTIEKLQVNIEETLLFTSPVYKLEISILGRMFAQNPWLYAAIFHLNPHTEKIIEILEENLTRFKNFYRKQKMEKFVEEFETISAHLGSFCERAYIESSKLVDFSANICNENEVESVFLNTKIQQS